MGDDLRMLSDNSQSAVKTWVLLVSVFVALVFVQTQTKTFISCNLCQAYSPVTTDFLVRSCCTEVEPETLEPNKYTQMFLFPQNWYRRQQMP